MAQPAKWAMRKSAQATPENSRYRANERFPPGPPPVPFRVPALDRSLARRLQRARRARALEPDDGRRHRRDRRADDPNRRQVARRLRVMQLPRVRPRPRDHRERPEVPGCLGNAPELVTHARQPDPLSANRGAPDGAPGMRGLARDSHDHIDPPFRYPGP